MSPSNPEPEVQETTQVEDPSLPVSTWAEVSSIKFGYAPEVVTAAMAFAGITDEGEVTSDAVESALQAYLNAPAHTE